MISLGAVPGRREQFAREAVTLGQTIMARTGGVTGAALRTGYYAMTLGYREIAEWTVVLFIEDADAQLALWQSRADAAGVTVREAVLGEADVFAESLLRRADERAAASRIAPYRALYALIRPRARGAVLASIDEVAAFVDRWCSMQRSS